MAYSLWLMARFTQGMDFVPFAEASHGLFAISYSYFITLKTNDIRKNLQKS
jgi:hypothetical protein